MKYITASEIEHSLRDAVCEAMDKVARELTGEPTVLGIKDRELTPVFHAIDAHAKVLAARLNDGTEPGSAGYTVYTHL